MNKNISKHQFQIFLNILHFYQMKSKNKSKITHLINQLIREGYIKDNKKVVQIQFLNLLLKKKKIMSIK
jgi:hypothetical protein